MKLKKSSIYKSLIANFFGIGVLLFNQIILVPFYLYLWNIDLYSDWIVITAISSFFVISNIGLNTVTANQFSISYTQKNYKECSSLLTNNYLLIVFIGIVILLSCLIFVSSFDLTSILKLHALDRQEANYIFVALITLIFISMVSTVPDAIYRANSKNHKGVYLNNMTHLFESIIILVSLLLHLSMTVMVTLYVLPQCLNAIYKHIDTHKIFRHKFSVADRNIPLLKQTLLPSLSFMSFPIGNSIVYQGFTVLVSRFFGAEVLILFNTTRTMCSFIRQVLVTLQYAVWPEYSIAYGNNNIIRMRTLHRKVFFATSLGAISMSIILLIFGKYIYTIWTHGEIAFSFTITLAFLIVMTIENIWYTSSICLMATNKHSKIGIAYISMAIASIAVAVILAHIGASIPSIIYCLLIIHVPLSYYTIKQGLKMTMDSWRGLFLSLNIGYLFKDKR